MGLVLVEHLPDILALDEWLSEEKLNPLGLVVV